METLEQKSTYLIQNLVTIDDYAKLINKSKRTVYNWISDKTLSPIEFMGRQYLDKTKLVLTKKD